MYTINTIKKQRVYKSKKEKFNEFERSASQERDLTRVFPIKGLWRLKNNKPTLWKRHGIFIIKKKKKDKLRNENRTIFRCTNDVASFDTSSVNSLSKALKPRKWTFSQSVAPFRQEDTTRKYSKFDWTSNPSPFFYSPIRLSIKKRSIGIPFASDSWPRQLTQKSLESGCWPRYPIFLCCFTPPRTIPSLLYLFFPNAVKTVAGKANNRVTVTTRLSMGDRGRARKEKKEREEKRKRNREEQREKRAKKEEEMTMKEKGKGKESASERFKAARPFGRNHSNWGRC